MRELLNKYGIKANRHKEKRCGQLFQYFQKNKSDKNDIIHYLSKIDSTQIDAEMTELPDVKNMSRNMLLNYCHENVPTFKPGMNTEKLRSVVFSHVFSSVMQNVD